VTSLVEIGWVRFRTCLEWRWVTGRALSSYHSSTGIRSVTIRIIIYTTTSKTSKILPFALIIAYKVTIATVASIVIYTKFMLKVFESSKIWFYSVIASYNVTIATVVMVKYTKFVPKSGTISFRYKWYSTKVKVSLFTTLWKYGKISHHLIHKLTYKWNFTNQSEQNQRSKSVMDLRSAWDFQVFSLTGAARWSADVSDENADLIICTPRKAVR